MVLSSVALTSCRDESQNSEEDLDNAPPTAPSENTDSTDATDDNTTAKVNPAHGEPGHRCDIPVGASLDQEPKAASSENTQMNESPIRVRSSQPKINPAHGEPGHDCSVPVGAELGE